MPAGEPLTCQKCGETFPRPFDTGRKPTYCEPCAGEQRLANHHRYKERKPTAQADASANYRKRHPGRSAENLRRHRAKFADDEEYQAKRKAQAFRDQLRRYGLTEGAFDAMVAEQEGRCAICGRTPEEANPKGWPRLLVDHDHDFDLVRQLLCWSCNVGLGHFGDDPGRIAKAFTYLTTWKDVHQDYRRRQAES